MESKSDKEAFAQHCIECLRLVMHLDRIVKDSKAIATTPLQHVQILRRLAGSEFSEEAFYEVAYNQRSYYEEKDYPLKVARTQFDVSTWLDYLSWLPLSVELPEDLRVQLIKTFRTWSHHLQSLFCVYKLAHPRVKRDLLCFAFPNGNLTKRFGDAHFYELPNLLSILESQNNPSFLLFFWTAKERDLICKEAERLFPEYQHLFVNNKSIYSNSALGQAIDSQFQLSGNCILVNPDTTNLANLLETKSRELFLVSFLTLGLSLPIQLSVSIARRSILYRQGKMRDNPNCF